MEVVVQLQQDGQGCKHRQMLQPVAVGLRSDWQDMQVLGCACSQHKQHLRRAERAVPGPVVRAVETRLLLVAAAVRLEQVTG